MTWKSRKFVAYFVWQAAWTVLLWFGKLPSDAYVQVTQWGFTAYCAGNVGEHFAKKGA